VLQRIRLRLLLLLFLLVLLLLLLLFASRALFSSSVTSIVRVERVVIVDQCLEIVHLDHLACITTPLSTIHFDQGVDSDWRFCVLREQLLDLDIG